MSRSAALLLLLAACGRAQPPPLTQAPIGTGFPLVREGARSRVEAAVGPQSGASVAGLVPTGGFVVAYERANASQIFACVYDFRGTQVVGEFQLNTDTSGVQGEVKVSGLADGGFVAVWRRLSTHELVGRSFSGGGVGVGDEFVVSQNLTGAPAGGHHVAGLAGGNLTVTWVARGVGVLCNVYEPSGQAMYEKPVTVRVWEHYVKGWTKRMQSGLTALDNGGFVVAASYNGGMPRWFLPNANCTFWAVVLTQEAAQVTEWELTHFVGWWDPMKDPLEIVVQSRGDELTFLSPVHSFTWYSKSSVYVVYSTNGTKLSELGANIAFADRYSNYSITGLMSPVSPTVEMLPSGDIAVTTGIRYYDAFGLNHTYAVYGQLYADPHNVSTPGYLTVGDPELLYTSTVGGTLVSSSAAISHSRMVVVGDTNWADGVPAVYCQIFNVRGLEKLTDSPQQFGANTTAPTTDSPMEVTTTKSLMEVTAQPVAPETASPMGVTTTKSLMEVTAQTVAPATDSPMEATAQPVVATTDSPW